MQSGVTVAQDALPFASCRLTFVRNDDGTTNEDWRLSFPVLLRERPRYPRNNSAPLCVHEP